MDVNRLSEVLSWLRSEENTHKFQAKITSVRDTLQNLANSPGDQSSQVNLANALQELASAFTAFQADYDPSQRSRISEIGGDPFFTTNLVESIKAQINANAMSPATVLEDVNQILEDRKKFIDFVVSTEEGADHFVPFTNDLDPGQSSIGFEIPREIFSNEFRDFIAELKTIQRIIRVFAEVEIGTVPEIKLGPISSTDPLIFLQAPPVLVASIAASVSWILTQWKKFEEIRKIRAETVKLGQFEKSEIEEFFDKKISEKLDSVVEGRVKMLMTESSLSEYRKAELDSEVAWALKALFARVERGMRVEVETSLLPEIEGEVLSDQEQQTQSALYRVQEISGELVFPRVESVDPILQLPRVSDGDENTRTKSTPRAKRAT